jgi:flagellin
MSLRINHNIASLNGHRNMVKNDAMVSKSLEKLSSGLKINRAADNAAGLVISEQMRAQLGGIKQAMNNTEQAVTMVQTAEGALDEMNTLLSKVKSLALHAMNSGVSDASQRSADNAEYQNILSSIDRIVGQTRFAGQLLLDGHFTSTGVATASGAAQFQVGEQGGDTVTVCIASVGTSALALGSAGTAITGLTTAASASDTLTLVSAAINTVTTLRGSLGAFQSNTLETGLRSLSVTHENLTAAESVIRDVDFAEESAVFTKNQILVQSATAMLAQANQLPQNVLKLLG